MAHTAKVSPETIERIRQLRELGFGNRLIARDLGISRMVVCRQLRMLGYSSKIFTAETRGFRHFAPETVNRVLELRKRAVSNLEIGIETGMTEKSASQILRRHGWRSDMSPVQERPRPLLTVEQKSLVLELHASGAGSSIIARQLEVRERTVRGVLRGIGYKRQGCKEKEAPQRQVREDISYRNLTPGLAWCLGLVVGDGCMSRNGAQVSLTSGDRDVVEKFAAIHGEVKVAERKHAWCATWCCARLYRELKVYGLCPNKSKIIQFPRLEPDILPHFVRGLIDSDGSFNRAGQDKLSHLLRFEYACICEPFMHDFREALVQHAGVSAERNVRGRYQSDTHNKVWKLKYCHADAVRLGRWAFAGSTPEIRCDRKYALWEAAKDHVLFSRSTPRTILKSQRESAATGPFETALEGG